MKPISRRDMLAATAAGGVVTAASAALAQTGEPIPQPRRGGRGGTDPGPRNLMRDQQNPDLLVPPSTDLARCRTCASHFPTRTCGFHQADGPVR